MPLFRLLPGLPSRIFSSLTAFFGGIFLLDAYVRRGEREGEKSGDSDTRRAAVNL